MKTCTLLSLWLALAATAATAAAQVTDERDRSLRLTSGLQRSDFGSLNAALAAEAYPLIGEGATRLSLAISERYPGRLRSDIGFWAESFDIGEDVVTPGPGFLPIRDTRSARLNSGGLSAALDFDLLYPSAWNVYLGVQADLGASRLVLSRLRENTTGSSGPQGPLERDVLESKFTVASIGFRPQLTLESIEIPRKHSSLRVVAIVGYRIGVSQDLGRENFEGQTIDVEVDPSGVTWQLGVSIGGKRASSGR